MAKLTHMRTVALVALVLAGTVCIGQTVTECPSSPALPKYPLIARAARLEGTVELQISVDGDGKPAAAPIKGQPMLVRSSIDVAEHWMFAPGKPRSFKMNFIFHVFDPKSKVEADGCSVSKILIDFPNVEIWATLPILNTSQPQKQ